jgi:predicted RND superfamily exporter protein
MGAYFKSTRVAIIALISILIPVLIGFGIWGWIYGSIGLAATVVVAITIGVVIDDSIHMIVRAHDGKEHLALNGINAAAYSVYRVGTAIAGTTLILAGAFSILLFSGFELNSSFGLCTVLILCSAMLFDLIALPHLIEWALPDEIDK